MSIPNRAFLTFLAIFLTVYGGAHLYLWWRLVHPLRLEGAVLWGARILCVLLIFSFPVVHFWLRHQDTWWIEAANYVSAVWAGTVLYFVLVTLGFDGLRLLTWGRIPTGPASSLAVAGITACIAVYGLWEARSIVVTPLRVPMANLPAHLEGMRVVQISDVHLGLIVRGDRLRSIVRQVNELNPDLILITGDLVDAEVWHMEDVVEPLRELRSKHGIFAVTGNHEYFANVNRAVSFMEQAGVQVLRNRLVEVAGGLQLVGRDDVVAERITRRPTPPLSEIMRGADKSKPTIFLYHTPTTSLAELESHGIELQLSGHTHRGQLWPFHLLVKHIFPETYYGHFTNGKATIYVSRGTGTWGPPMRVGARPEITLVTLTRSP
jgi:predicted MPP superfamily phosphohydrolase